MDNSLIKIISRALRIGGLFVVLSLHACTANSLASRNIAIIQNQNVVADSAMLTQVAQAFYQTHPDSYDILVIWGAADFAPGHSFYLPIKNDVPGIGYQHVGDELFDNSADYGSQNLQGIVWMGPDWITNDDASDGPRSNLGILVQETGHRWAATLYFYDADLGTDSAALLEDDYHWSTYLNTEDSPMGGNNWEALGDSLYHTEPADSVRFCPLDLYTMGLLNAAEVPPITLLTNAHTAEAFADISSMNLTSQVSQPVTVEASVEEITIDQIIAAEGERYPDVGFNASMIRQAWIYVYRDANASSSTDIAVLEELKTRWSDYFSAATGGLAVMNTDLH